MGDYGYLGKNHTGIIQYATIATTGFYDITAYGAQGGNAKSSSSSTTIYQGGKGALIEGEFYLSAGTVLKLVVGGTGQSGYLNTTNVGGGGGGGGGGGSFVIETNNGSGSVNIPLLVAGGGGGAGSQQNGYAANIGNYGSDGSGRGGAGGTNGAPGQAGFYRLPAPFFSHYSGGGGGFSGGRGGTGNFGPRNGYAAGVVPISNNGYPTLYSGGGPRNAYNGALYTNALGGFGGGGGGAASTGGYIFRGGGGGGGGFGGGGGGGYTGFYGGGGGGGSLDTGNALVAKSGVSASNGLISIQNRPTGVYGYLGFVRTDTITTSGWYELTAYGAQGGRAFLPVGTISGGGGAEVSGFFSLAAGTVLELVVGGVGKDGIYGAGAGGGGGSFIIETNNGVNAVDIPLLIGGGGGGASTSYKGYGGVVGTTGGRGGQYGGAGGGGGNGGGGGGVYGGGGGGYRGGAGATYTFRGAGPGYGRGDGYAGGSAFSGPGKASGGVGGYGGGGGGGGRLGPGSGDNSGAGGGGGGYGGGGGGSYRSNRNPGAGGGGGSLDTGTTGTGTAAVQSGNGQILIKPVAAPIVNYGYTGTVQAVTLLSSGWYDLAAFGAQGGNAVGPQFAVLTTGGNGAEVGGFFSFSAGTVLDLVVGGAGKTGVLGSGGGGGGGSFIVEVNNGTSAVDSVLLVAGGGGGAASNRTTTGNGAAAAISPEGSAGGGYRGGAGGLNGAGGDSAAYFGGGGGGYAGGTGWNGSSQTGGSGSGRGGSYAGGGSILGGSGGFGGGGGASGYFYKSGGGGGGGYGGGGGGGYKSGHLAGGGGAGGVRDIGSTAIGQAGVQTGNGAITIEQVAAPIASYGFSGKIETITIVTSGEYDLTAYGAQGGGASFATGGTIASGGAGAEVRGEFSLAAGTVLEVVVGGAGYFGGSGRNAQGGQGGGGGGGGSFIIETNNGVSAVDIPLLIAGGGGGASTNANGYGGVTGSTGGSGGQIGGAGGSGGQGGNGGFYHGGGGGGYSGGYGGTYATKTGYAGGGKGTGFAGGAGYYFNSPFKIGRGGFGGGGGGSGIGFSGNGVGGAGGGGGGYGGGGGGGYSKAASKFGGGGGGGSLDTGADAYAKGSVRSGDGLVLIEMVECFLAGTRIATPAGEVPVEHLRVGDMVSTLVGDKIVDRPIRWAGRRGIRVTHPDQAPVRIRAGAFGEAIPRRDLLVTGEHCVLVAGSLVPARMLVNGRSILVDRNITAYTFHHLEFFTHAILLAENLPAESFLDTGNRRNFSGSAFPALRPDFGVNAGHKSWQTHAAAPLAVDRATVEPIWRALAARAAAWPAATEPAELTVDPDLHLVTETGNIIRPSMANGRVQNFVIPAGVTQLRLRSKTFRPAETIGPFCDDRRCLGVLAGAVSLWSARRQRRLEIGPWPGWHAPEPDGQARWTNGDAVLHLPESAAPRLLQIEILQAGPYALSISQQLRAAA